MGIGTGIRLTAVLLLTVVCLALALRGIELGKAERALAHAHWPWLLAAAGCYLGADVLKAWRLRTALGVPLRFVEVFSVTVLGSLAINVVPLRLGEAVRPTLLMDRYGVPFGAGVGAAFIERVLDLAMLLVMLLGLGWVVTLPEGGLLVRGVSLVPVAQATVATSVALGVVAGGALLLLGQRADALLRRLPLSAMVVPLVQRFRGVLADLLGQPMRGLGLVVQSVCIWALVTTAVGCGLMAFSGLPTGPGPAWATWTVTMSGLLVLPTPGFFGAYELFYATALELWSVDRTLAGIAAVVVHLVQFAYTVSIGGVFMAREGLGLRALLRGPGTKP